MKRIVYTSNLVRTFMAVALAGMMSACVEDHLYPDVELGADGGLSVYGTVSDGVVVTKAASDVDLKEKDLNTLDVFVEHVTNGTGDGTFIARGKYHLPYTNGEAVKEQVDNWLADNWREQGLEEGQKYNVYVAVNNPKTKENVDDVAALKALVSKDETIYKLYNANPGDYRGLTSTKEFMMDGVIKNWTPEPNVAKQVFGKENTTLGNTKLTLNRAAAKFVVNVKFDADFLKSLTKEKKTVEGQEEWVDKPESEQVTITGSPAWTFYNFAFQAPVFTPETQGDGIDVRNSTQRIIHNQSYTGEDKHFQIITYSYPNRWAKADFATAAPSLVVSVGFKDNNGDTNYHYYRIPLVKNSDSDDYGVIERNHIYVVNATIATRGSAAQEDADEIGDVKYKVVNWNDESNSAAIHNEVEAVQHLYLKVNPKVYTLRGDGSQSVDINYLKATGTKVNWKLFTYDAEGNQTGVVAHDAEGATRAWFYNATGGFTTTYGDSNQNPWVNMGVTISQSTEGSSGSGGKFTVTSQALTNKAIKYIRFRVYLEESQSLYEDVIIRHFPTDNIQSIDGHWSSYHDGSSSSQYETWTTTDLSEAQAWAEQYGVSYTSSSEEVTENLTYNQYRLHEGEEGYAIDGPTEVSTYDMYQAIGDNDDIKSANSQANAVFGVDDYYYWGVNPSQVYNVDYYSYDYDYYEGRRNVRYYKYQTRYKAAYTRTYTKTTYSVEVPISSTGGWVDWDDQDNHTPARTYSIDYDEENGYSGNYSNRSTFHAKVYDNGYIYAIAEQYQGTWDWSYWYKTVRGNSETATNNNNHMYVIQISSTSNDYVLGRPYVNATTHQSDDDVVSPAFMIASQLGTVTPFTGTLGPTNAAEHCSRYMEVGLDGTRYKNWRLPTKAEISVITGYQYGKIDNITIPTNYRVMIPVLTGMYYHSLSGESVLANPDADDRSRTPSYLRCVRDLSAAEVERLNGFDKIVEKYQNK